MIYHNFNANPDWISENIEKNNGSHNPKQQKCSCCGTDKSLHYIRDDGKVFCNVCILSNLRKIQKRANFNSKGFNGD